MKKAFFILFLCLFFLQDFSSQCSANSLSSSVVKVFVTSNRMDYYRPWQARGSSSTTGSGCVVEGNRILTNAHVVDDYTFIQVRKESDPKKYTAKVEAMGHDCDLAVLSVEDPEFFEDLTPLNFGELPQLQETVAVVGFPFGGDKISITKGVVSRIEVISYTQSARKLLAVQIDAAINPGNSGGPVFLDGKLVGVAMQLVQSSQNIGYMIPVPIIKHFLKDLIDKKYDGFPTLGVDFRNTESKTLRSYYRINDQDGGVLITRVLPHSPAHGIIKEGDILLRVDDTPVGIDGTFEFQDDQRLSMSYLISRKQMGDQIVFQLSREGEVLTKEVKFKSFPGLVPVPRHFKKPSYYIYGGFVFTILSSDLLRSWGKNWWAKAPLDFLHYLAGTGRLNLDAKKEIVVLLEVLPDDLNVGYHSYHNMVITKVNGQAVESFKDFIVGLESNKDPYTIIQTDHQLKIILDNQKAQNTTQLILERNHIPQQSSDDVAAWISQKISP
ncbi:MAG: trypsin-like peptidase domain-containing protein [Candidatus Omnitrophica bacterium]|nr:trypsin-like peptidase domain-containing protein [Candidatus Omnitrophota bacterium]